MNKVYSPQELLAKVRPDLKLSKAEKHDVSDLAEKVIAALENDARHFKRTEADLKGNRWTTHLSFPSYKIGLVLTEVIEKFTGKGWIIEYDPRQQNPEYGKPGEPSFVDYFHIRPKAK